MPIIVQIQSNKDILQPSDQHAELERAARVGVDGEPLGLSGREEVFGVEYSLADENILTEEFDLIYLSTRYQNNFNLAEKYLNQY